MSAPDATSPTPREVEAQVALAAAEQAAEEVVTLRHAQASAAAAAQAWQAWGERLQDLVDDVPLLPLLTPPDEPLGGAARRVGPPDVDRQRVAEQLLGVLADADAVAMAYGRAQRARRRAIREYSATGEQTEAREDGW